MFVATAWLAFNYRNAAASDLRGQARKGRKPNGRRPGLHKRCRAEYQEQIRVMANASGKAMPAMIITNATKAGSTGASARTSGPKHIAHLEPPPAFARRPKVERSKMQPSGQIVALPPQVGHLSEQSKIEPESLTRSCEPVGLAGPNR
jgi:hypothetical protein